MLDLESAITLLKLAIARVFVLVHVVVSISSTSWTMLLGLPALSAAATYWCFASSASVAAG